MRARPSASPEAASRHLFRHLWDLIELRRNPIVASLFATKSVDGPALRRDERIAEGIRASVRRLADEVYREEAASAPDVARRRHAIVIEGDLERTPRQLVARRLGLSARQYTRDQHSIRGRIVALLHRELQAPAGTIAVEGVGLSTPLARVAVLAGLGMPLEALVHADRILGGCDEEVAVSALCLRSTILSSHLGDHAAAGDALSDAKVVLDRIESSDASRIVAEAEVELARSRLDATQGAFERAVRRSWRAFELLQASHANEERTFQLRACSASFHAYVSQLTGDLNAASESLQHALRAYRAASDWLGCERAEFLLQTGIVLKGLAQFMEAAHYLREASSIARQSGLIVQALLAELTLGILVLNRGDLAGSRAVIAACCAEAERIGHAAIVSAAHLYLARWYTQAPQPKAAVILREVERAREHCPPGSPHWIDGKVAESFGRLLLGDVVAADQAARVADDAAVSSGCVSLRSGTLREMARVAHVQRRTRDATRSIRKAIDIAYTNGKMWEAARAHDLAAIILGERRHRKEAALVRRSLASS